MPIYEYVCDKCDTQFEALRPASRMDEPAPCPGGHGGARRVLSTFAAHTGDGYAEDGGDFEGGGGCGGGCSGCSCGNGV